MAEIQGSTGAVVEAISQITTVIQEMREISTTVAAAVEEQHTTANSIARNISEAADGAKAVAAGIDAVREMVSNTHRTVEDVLAASDQIAGHSTDLSRAVDDFVKKIMA